jgi:serine/threonine protein kinase
MVPSQRYCTRCGAVNQGQDAFCFACGHPLQGTSASQQYPLAGSSSNTSTGLLLPNLLLKGRYRILGTIGKGGFGAVYKAEDVQLGNRLLGVKEMSQSSLNPQEIAEAAENFKREAHILAALKHPNLPSIYEQFSEAGRWYLIMDFIEGETLEDHAKKDPQGHLSVKETLQIGLQLCTVLAYLHSRQPPIIFRDLKPSNIMLTPEGNLYLIDFGIARHFKPGQNKDTIAFGSPGYAAPEQYGKAQTTPQSDIYSLGATLHHLLSGSDPSQSPFVFAPLSSATIPAELATLILRMVKTEANQRPANVAEVKQELQRIAAHPTGSQLPPTQYVGGLSLPPTQFAAPTPLSQLSSTVPGQPFPPVKPSVIPASLTPPAQTRAPSTLQKTKEQWKSEGNTHYHAKRYQEALAAFEQAIRLNPNDALAYNGKGRSLRQLRRYREALAAYEQAIRLNPNYAGAYHNKGVVLIDLKRYQEALAAFEQAIRLNPNNADYFYGKSLTLEKLGKKREAQQAREKEKQLGYRRLLPTTNLSSTPSRRFSIGKVFSMIGMIFGVILVLTGCIMAFTSLVSVGLRLFPAGVANVFIGLMIFFIARMRKSSLPFSIIGIFVGVGAILSGIGIMIIAANFPDVIINEVSGGRGSAGLESGTVIVIAGVILLGTMSIRIRKYYHLQNKQP